LTIFKYIYMYM